MAPGNPGAFRVKGDSVATKKKKTCFFLWGHSFKKYGRKKDGYQQFRCTKCGYVKQKQVRPCLLGHRWKRDRRMAKGVIKCRVCGITRTVQRGM